MVSLPLFDVVLASDQAPERSLRMGEQLVESALTELRQIEKLDESLSPGEGPDLDRLTATLVRGMYEDWAREADALLDRVGRMERRFGGLRSSESLRDAHGKVRAMLSIPPDRFRSSPPPEGARTYTLEEVRRELRLGVQ